MATIVAPILSGLQPQFAVLVGIAGAVKIKGMELGYVPFADQVVAYGDIAVENGQLTFRNAGYQVDAKLRRAAGEIRSDAAVYAGWQSECTRAIAAIVPVLNELRPTPIKLKDAKEIQKPHLVVGVTGSGPFLLRDADLRGKLVNLPDCNNKTEIKGIDVSGPIHPKLISTEMEAHGFMEACHQAEIPASVLKGISDLGDEGKAKLEEESGGFYRAYACSNAVVSVLHMLHQKPRSPREP